MKRGDIYLADLNPVLGCEQGGVRPVLVIQNDIGNHFSPSVIIAAITSKVDKAIFPTHVLCDDHELKEKSVILLEQIRTVDKSRLKCKLCSLSFAKLQEVDKKLLFSLGVSV